MRASPKKSLNLACNALLPSRTPRLSRVGDPLPPLVWMILYLFNQIFDAQKLLQQFHVLTRPQFLYWTKWFDIFPYQLWVPCVSTLLLFVLFIVYYWIIRSLAMQGYILANKPRERWSIEVARVSTIYGKVFSFDRDGKIPLQHRNSR